MLSKFEFRDTKNVDTVTYDIINSQKLKLTVSEATNEIVAVSAVPRITETARFRRRLLLQSHDNICYNLL